MKKLFILGLAVLLTACSPNTEDHLLESETESVTDIAETEPIIEPTIEPIVEPITEDQTGCSLEDSYVSEPITFVWEKVGFGGECTITLEPYNEFQLYEGDLSSAIGRGYFDVDGDIITLKESATSDKVKTFRFRINSDKTKLTFIANGSDRFSFCKLEDGDIFGTEIHHDISEYWESKQNDSGESDVVPAIMVNDELYFSTGQESAVTEHSGNLDGKITLTVASDRYPIIDDQSNFGFGFGYQYGSEEGTIEVYMAEGNSEKRWIVFKKEEQITESGIVGVDVRLASVSNKSIGVEVSNNTEKEIIYKTPFKLIRVNEYGMEFAVPTLKDEYDFRYSGYAIASGKRMEDTVPISNVYGELEPGTYRFYKNITIGDFDGGSSVYEYALTFTVLSNDYTLDYGESELYTYQDREKAVAIILNGLKEWDEKGGKLHAIRYAGDDCNSEENIRRMNDLSPDGTEYTQCIEFLMDFQAPETDADAWDSGTEYKDWQWWLARNESGGWKLIADGKE